MFVDWEFDKTRRRADEELLRCLLLLASYICTFPEIRLTCRTRMRKLKRFNKAE